jgi:hypothetical protein
VTVLGTNGIYYLVEVKAVRHATDEDVMVKRTAAENWARLVTDQGNLGTWRYVFVTENIVKSAKTWDAVLTQLAADLRLTGTNEGIALGRPAVGRVSVVCFSAPTQTLRRPCRTNR